jgi:hypothetical protein
MHHVKPCCQSRGAGSEHHTVLVVIATWRHNFWRRPDFLTLADCQPAAGTTLTGQPLTIGASGTQSLLEFPCRASVKTQRNARQSFVSGAAQLAACVRCPCATSALPVLQLAVWGH